VKAEEDYILRN